MDTNRSEKPLARIITIVLNAAKHLHPLLACVLTCCRHALRQQDAGYLVSYTPVRVSVNTIHPDMLQTYFTLVRRRCLLQQF
jgi:hypothetical protein